MGRNAAMKNSRKMRRETRLCKLLTLKFMVALVIRCQAVKSAVSTPDDIVAADVGGQS